MRTIIIAGFVLMIAAQWYAPLSMMFKSQTTIEEGTEYKFKTRPVDPTDPFRGKYVTLDFEAETYMPADTNELKLTPGTTVYAMLGVDSAGYAKVSKVMADPPGVTTDFIEAKLGYSYDNTIFLEFPFKRFYLEESKASEAEQLYWQSRRDSSVIYGKVMILNGDAKLTDVIINDSSIVDVVERINANKEN